MKNAMVNLISKETTASFFKSNFMDKSGGEVPVSACFFVCLSCCVILPP